MWLIKTLKKLLIFNVGVWDSIYVYAENKRLEKIIKKLRALQKGKY